MGMSFAVNFIQKKKTYFVWDMWLEAPWAGPDFKLASVSLYGTAIWVVLVWV